MYLCQIFFLGASTSTQVDFDPDVEIKIEERDPLDMESDDGDNNDDGHDPGDDMDFDPGELERSETPEPPEPTKSPAKQSPPKQSPAKQSPAKQATQISKEAPKKQTPAPPAKKTPAPLAPKPTTTNKSTPNKPDPKTATLLVANSLGMVRVNAKALPHIKPGIYSVGSNEQLSRIKPLVPKVPSTPKSGLVVITNNPNSEKPGVRRKPLTPLTAANKAPVIAPKAPAVTKVQVGAQQRQVVVNAPALTSAGNVKATTTFTLPPNPGKLPFLVMAPPGSGMGALLITPTADNAEQGTVNATS